MKNKTGLQSSEATLAYQREYYQRNKEKIKARVKAHIAAHPERHAKYVADYAKRNPEIGKKSYWKHLSTHKGTTLHVQKAMIRKSRARAMKLGVPHDITLDYIISIWPHDNKCPVLGTTFVSSANNLMMCASLDRIDNSLGYVEGNVAVVCWRANSLKSNAGTSEITRIVEYLKESATILGVSDHSETPISSAYDPRVTTMSRTLTSRSKKRATDNNWDFNLTWEYVQSIWPTDCKCPVFGIDFFTDLPNKQNRASLDRIDSTMGYIVGNVRVVSWKANSLKSNGTLREFEAVLDYMRRNTAA